MSGWDADVIVVGAGAAGLAAALQLATRSVRVIALESRDHIGGRVMWQSVGTVSVPAELGAEFIHGAAPETSALLREAGLAKVETVTRRGLAPSPAVSSLPTTTSDPSPSSSAWNRSPAMKASKRSYAVLSTIHTCA